MNSLKKFFMYILMLVALYIFVSITSFAFINKAYKKIENYEILTSSPKIEIVESKATYVNGYVIAEVTNNTGVEIDKTYLKLDLYTDKGNYLGTKYNEINDFSNNEVLEVKTNFKFNGVEHYKISLVNNISADSLYNDDDELKNGLFYLVGISGIIMLLYYIL